VLRVPAAKVSAWLLRYNLQPDELACSIESVRILDVLYSQLRPITNNGRDRRVIMILTG
jgi:hypothetical protein